MTKTGKSTSGSSELRCSFCQKRQNDIHKLIAGPSVYICDECVEVCQQIIADDTRVSGAPIVDGRLTPTMPVMPAAGAAVMCALCRMPTPLDDGVLIQNRGVLCPGCIAEIDIAIASRRNTE